MVSELHSLSECWFQAWLEKDAATVERMAAEDYIYVSTTGSILDRPAILAIIRSQSYRLDHATRTVVVVRAVGNDSAVVRHHYMVWEKQAGEWRLVMEQCSLSSK